MKIVSKNFIFIVSLSMLDLQSVKIVDTNKIPLVSLVERLMLFLYIEILFLYIQKNISIYKNILNEDFLG